MSDRSVGRLFVTLQVALLATLILLPSRDDFAVPDQLRWVSNVVFWLGIVVIGVSAATLGRSLTATPVPTDRAELRTAGPYRFARHPIYSGVILVVVALGARSGSWLTVAVGVITVAFFVGKSSWEEQRLNARFDAYADYAARTGRFFPGW
jgi:protein-S-isoprenylcysteine O-methyltransferase Ste14